jgi:hypothetical protein
VELLVNELSIHGQFGDLSTFRIAIGRVMEVRETARRYGRQLRCHRNIANAQVTPTLTLPEAVGALSTNDRRALMQWVTRQGPFWDDERRHGPDDYLECNDAVVTDSAVGEAAVCCLEGAERRVVSVRPSGWETSPLVVTWTTDAGAREASVMNHLEAVDVEAALQAAAPASTSWDDVASYAADRFPNLTIASDAFDGLRGHPFSSAAAERIRVLLSILDRFKTCFDEEGNRTPEGHQIYQDHFTGKNAWFTDSSDDEKIEFSSELTFRHPADKDETLACPWHGKIKTGQLRIHFSSPVRATDPLFVVYVGPKLTKR